MGLLTPYLARSRTAKIAPYVRGAVLDLGCGSHGTAAILEEYGNNLSSYCGVERSEDSVRMLKTKYPGAEFHARDLDRDALNLDARFDCVLMIALIEHLFNQQHVMSQVAGALNQGGVVVLTTPTPFGNDVVHRIGGKLGLFSQHAVDDHIVIYNHHRFRIMAAEVGLQLKFYRTFQLQCNQLAVLVKP